MIQSCTYTPNALLTGDGSTRIVLADLRDPERILAHPKTRELIDFREPVALLLVAILHFISGQENPAGGAADPIRQLPTMPRPDHALAAIAAGCSVYFLTRARASLWPPDGSLREMPGLIEEPPAGVTRTAGPVVLWHSSGSRTPLPPGPGSDGEPAYWMDLPSRRVVLSLPVALLDLLAKAVSATQDTMMAIRLPGGVLAIPAGKVTRSSSERTWLTLTGLGRARRP